MRFVSSLPSSRSLTPYSWQGKDEGLEDMQDMMDDALSMAQDFKEEKEATKQ